MGTFLLFLAWIGVNLAVDQLLKRKKKRDAARKARAEALVRRSAAPARLRSAAPVRRGKSRPDPESAA